MQRQAEDERGPGLPRTGQAGEALPSGRGGEAPAAEEGQDRGWQQDQEQGKKVFNTMKYIDFFLEIGENVIIFFYTELNRTKILQNSTNKLVKKVQ